MIRILLVDDHPLLRHGVRSVLETQSDFTVVAEAGSLNEVTELIVTAAPDIVLIDLDLGPDLPGGIEVTRAILQLLPEVVVLILTAYDSDADIVRAVDAGATGYVLKDSHPTELFAAIRAAQNGTHALSGGIERRLRERTTHPDRTLTGRELEVLSLAAEGLSNRDLARMLFVSEATVKTHLHHIFTKLEVDSRQAAIAAALKRGLIRI